MRVSLRWLAIGCVLLLASCAAYKKADEAYQRDMDQVRVQHAHRIMEIMEAYYARQGHYPLADKLQEGRVIEVFLTPRSIHKGILEQVATLPMDLLPFDMLQQEVFRVLGESAVLPTEPQKVATYAPNYHIYHLTPINYCVGVHLYFPHERAQLVQGGSSRYYKYDVCKRIGKAAG